MRFKEQHPFEKRLAESTRIRNKHFDRVPVIVERSPSSSSIPMIDRKKYLVPSDLKMAEFIFVIRKRIKLGPEDAIFVYVNGSIPPLGDLMSTIYRDHADEDGFLYITYSGETTFGC